MQSGIDHTTRRAPDQRGRTWYGIERPDDEPLDGAVWSPTLQRTTRLVMGLTLVAAVVYAAFVLHPSNRGDWGPYLALVVAEGILLANAAAILLTSLADDGDRWDDPEVFAFRVALVSGREVPSVDVLITVCGEPLAVVERTVRAARDMRLAHRTWVCDDGRSDEVRDLCERLGVDYLRRADRVGVKAGNANSALRRTSGELVALFDADHVPHEDFLVVTLPHLANPDVAFVQCPQAYRYERRSFVEIGSAQSQQLFYEVVCPGKNRFNAAFHVGTNAVFRRTALDDVGGFYEDTHSEDIWTSIRLHQRGWRSIFLPHIVARGLSPETVNAYFRQQFRWASGSFEILLRSNPVTMKGLTVDQKVQYLTPPLHFLQGFSNLWFLLLPPMFLLFGWTPLQADSATWLSRFLPFWLLTQAVLWLQAGGIRVRPVALSVATAPIHVRAFFAVLLRRAPTWHATNQRVAPPTVTEVTLPHLALAAINLTGIVVGLTSIENAVGTAICVGLCLLHLVILGTVITHAAIDRHHLLDHIIDLRDPAPGDTVVPSHAGAPSR